MKIILCVPIFSGTKSRSQHHLALQQGRNSCIFRHFYKPNQNFSTNTNLAHFSNCQNNLQSSHHLSFQTLQRIFHILRYSFKYFFIKKKAIKFFIKIQQLQSLISVWRIYKMSVVIYKKNTIATIRVFQLQKF